MTKKQEFLDMWRKVMGTGHPSPEEYYMTKKFGKFAGILNSHPELRSAFREAWKDEDVEDDAAAGLSQLFDFSGGN